MTETDILTDGAAVEAVTDMRPRAPLPERCFACAAPVRGPYCYACGQKNDDCRRSLWKLGGETVRDVTALDGRFLRTMRSVVTRPGRHLRRYGDGVRSPYTPPIRLFLVVSFAFFATMSLTDRQIVVFQPNLSVTEDGDLKFDRVEGGFFTRAKDLRYGEDIRAAIRAGAAEAASDARAEMAETPEEEAAAQEAAATRSLDAGEDDGITLGGRVIGRDEALGALIRFAENPRAFNNVLDDWIGRIMVLMIPLMALLGAVFVRGRDALLYDHLLLSLNTHAVAFGLMTLGLWLGWLIPGVVFVALLLGGMPVYYGAALRGATGRRKRKVIAATLFVFFVYLLVLFGALLAAAINAFSVTL